MVAGDIRVSTTDFDHACKMYLLMRYAKHIAIIIIIIIIIMMMITDRLYYNIVKSGLLATTIA